MCGRLIINLHLAFSIALNMFCNNCGTQINESAKFCTNCGNKIDAGSLETVIIKKKDNWGH